MATMNSDLTAENQYVNETVNGGRFLASVKMVFASKIVKDKFELSVGAIPLKNARLKAGIEKLNAKEKENSSMEVRVFQEGGKLSSLKHAIKSTNPVNCKLSEWKKCEQLLQNLIDYSTNVFSKDIENGHTNVISFKTANYKVEHFPFNKKFIKDRNKYVSLISKSLKDTNDIETLLMSAKYALGANKKKALKSVLDDLKENREILYQNFSVCLSSRANKIRCEEPSKLGLNKIDRQAINFDARVISGPGVGGMGGSIYSLSCPNYIRGFYGTQGNGLDQIGAICENSSSTALTGKHVAVEFIDTCDPGYLVTGFKAATGRVSKATGIITLSFKCENIESIKAGDNSDIYWINTLKAEREKHFFWNCPKNTAAFAVKGRSGKIIDRFGLDCRSI